MYAGTRLRNMPRTVAHATILLFTRFYLFLYNGSTNFHVRAKRPVAFQLSSLRTKKFSRGRGISVKLSTGLIFCSFFLLSRRFQISMFFFESIAPLEAWSHQKAPAIFYSRENLLGTRKHRLKSKFALEISANRHGSCEGMESSEGPCRSANAQCGQRSGTPLS